MSAKKNNSSRKRSRPVKKQSAAKKIKRNKSAMFLSIFIVIILVASSSYAIFQFLGGETTEDNTDNTNIGENTDDNADYQDDSEYKEALSATNNPVAVLETSKGVIAVELYENQAPKTCQNFINLVDDDFYNGMIFHRVMDDFMIQAGNTMPDGSTKTSPYGNIEEFEGGVSHENGAISMASTGAGVPGSAQFFICDGAQPSLDGSYAAFGKTIYGMDVVQDIADEPHDGSYGNAGGGRPNNDIIIENVYMAKK